MTFRSLAYGVVVSCVFLFAGEASGQTCGNAYISQNLDPTSVGINLGISCETQTHSLETRYARSYAFAGCRSSRRVFAITCVEFAVEFNTVGDYDATVNIYRDLDGGAPCVELGAAVGGCTPDLELLDSAVVTIPVVDQTAANEDKFFRAEFFPGPVLVRTGDTIVVEILFPDRTLDPGFIRAGANNTGETLDPETLEPQRSYVRAPECAVPTYFATNSLGFPDAMLIQVIRGFMFGPPRACPADCATADGAVDIEDFLDVLANFGRPGGCDFAPNGGDGKVGIDEFLAVLTAWGPCPESALVCDYDADNNGVVGIDDFLNVRDEWERNGCSAFGIEFSGDIGADDFRLMLNQCDMCP